MKTKKKQKTILIIIVLVIVLAIAGVWAFLSNRVHMNPKGTIGNTAGNIYNDGLFCEYNGTVYFSNTADNGQLCAMNADETNVRKLNSLRVRNILAGGKYVYFFQMGNAEVSDFNNIISTYSFNRCNLDGKKSQNITQDTVVSGQLVDNYLYLLTSKKDDISFYKMKIDKSENLKLANYDINPACAENGTIYYSDTKDNHILCTLDSETDVASILWTNNIWNPIVLDDYVYYMDIDEDYRLCRYSLSQDVIEVLTEDRVDCFNVGNGYIYYQKNGKDAALKCMRLDGSNVQVIAEGNYTNINITSEFVYFQIFNNPKSLFHSRIGSAGYEPFKPVME